MFIPLRLWKIPRLRGLEDWSESSGSTFTVHGVIGRQIRSAFEPLHEWTLFDPISNEEKRTATCFYPYSTSWYKKLHTTAVPKYSSKKEKNYINRHNFQHPKKISVHVTLFLCVFQTPTLIVFGALDTNLGAQSHKNLMQLPHSSVLKLEGARHACYMDKPKEFHQGLINFLSKLEWDVKWLKIL